MASKIAPAAIPPNSTKTVSKYVLNAKLIERNNIYLSVSPIVISSINNNNFGMALIKPFLRLGSHVPTQLGMSTPRRTIPKKPISTTGNTSEVVSLVIPNLVAKYTKGPT